MAHGPRILVTRSPHQASALADRLRALGAEPILIPTIELIEPTSFERLDDAIRRLSADSISNLLPGSIPFHWLLFTSANAVEALDRRRRALSADAVSNEIRIASIGAATTRVLASFGLQVDLQPPQAIAESLAEALVPYARQPNGLPTRFLLIRAEKAREHLPETLRAAGADVTVVPAYRNVTPAGSVEALRQLFSTADFAPDAITFTSSSTARNFFELLASASIVLPPQSVLASIGPVTSATMRELGYPPHTESKEATIEALAKNIIEFLKESVRSPGLVR